MHNKTWVTGLGWFISVGGWFLWNVMLSFAWSPHTGKTYPLYPIADGFLTRFGHNLLWWLVVLLSLAGVICLELATSSIRKAFWPTDTDLFQEFQKDPVIRRRFEETVAAEERGETENVEMGHDKTSMKRESEIQIILDERRRIGDETGEMIKSPTEQRSSTHLTRRKHSTDAAMHGEDIELAIRAPPKTRHSVDIAEVLGRRPGAARTGSS
jgi:phospholipid-translocating ATPase